MSVNTTDPMIGRLVDGRYQVRSRIARGGMATVYLATDLRLERRVAIKIMHGHLADDSKFRERFIQEARSAARLAHPNVVNVFDQGQDSEMAYLVMEYLPGITLRDLLQERHILTTEQSFDILEAVLSGLSAAHKAGIVHRDLKPENVLLADDGRIKIGDFGLARAASANTATGAALLGTIAYLSPELVTRGIADTRSDIYAVGIMMYEMLAGEQPFKGEQPMQIAYQHANDSVPSPSSKNPRVLAELDELVLWATARDPEDRPRDAKALLDQLLATRDELQTALPASSTATQRTVVMPAAGFSGSNDETQVLGSRARAATGPVLSDPTTALTTITGKRRKRGWRVFTAIAIITALAGGAGWYFGTGPGSRITIPESIVGMKADAASAQLSELGLVVDSTTLAVYDPFVESGFVAGTDPKVGSSVPKQTHVTVKVSKGAAPVAVPAIIGVDQAVAKRLLKDAGLIYKKSDSSTQFSDSIAKGIVISAEGVDDTGKSIALKNGAPYFDHRPVSLVVSLGPLPPLEGLTLDAAIDALHAVGVDGEEGPHTFSDTVPVDKVIGAVAQVDGAPIAPNDRVLIVISKGQDLVAIPDIVGKTVNEATKLLKSAEFTVKVDSELNSIYWGIQTVDSFSPGDAGGSLKRGTEITIKARG